MDQFGLTEAEKRTNLHRYNHALFRNMMCFLDIAWEINVCTRTMVILEDREEPSQNGSEYVYEAIFQDYITNRIMQSDHALFRRYLSFENIRKCRQQVAFDLHMCSKKGIWNLYHIVLTPAFDPAGALSCVYFGGRNIQTEESQALTEYYRQQQFRGALMSNSYFHYTFDVTGDGMIREDFVTTDGLHLIREISGMDLPVPFETFSKKWIAKYHPKFDKQPGEEIFTIAYLKRAFARKERLIDIEVQQASLHGGDDPSFIQIFIVLLENPMDKHIYAYVIWRDISLLRREVISNNWELRTSNESLRKIIGQEEQFRLASLSGAILVYNINLTKNRIENEFYEIVDNKRYPVLQLVGLTAPCSFDEYCKRWCKAKVPEDSREQFLRVFNRNSFLEAYDKGERCLDVEFDTVIGRGIPITLRNTVLLTRDNATGDILATVSGKDVSAQKAQERRQREALRSAYEAANQANVAKSDFLARMSHDIRTPMNAIMGMTAIARTHLDDTERVADCLSKIAVSSKHLLGLINEMLDMNKIESGQVHLQEENFILLELIDNLVAMCKAQIQAKHQSFSVSIHDIQHERVTGDIQRIQQSFMNLMSNAVKYTPEGGTIKLTVTERPTNHPRVGCYEFIFEDNGIGMSQEFLSHLFEPFVRSDDYRTAKLQGTGLGMAITKNIVQMMNGTIDVESELNKGTKFTVTIFLKLQEEERSESYTEFQNLPILVVDDEEDDGKIACEALDSLGMKSEWVQTGQEAVERVVERDKNQTPYYAVLLDWKMPEMDGVAVTRELRKRVGNTLPIVILSAYDWSDIEQQARTAGATSFLGKPLFQSRITHLFRELSGHTASDEQISSMEALEQEDFSGHRVLLVEDNELNAEIAEEILEMVGLEVDHVHDGKEAVDKMASIPDDYYDLIFMDIQMPIMNGYEATQAIRAFKRPYTKRIPILAMSANAFAEDIQASKKAGMNDHIAKPLDLSRLQKVLHDWIPKGTA